MIKRFLYLTIMILTVSHSLLAQKFSIENVYEVTLKSAGPIQEATEIKGYYFFYVSDKIDKKTNQYTLRITDDKLKKLKDINFQDSKDVSVLKCASNGSDIMIIFHYLKKDKIQYQIYGPDGNKKYSYESELKDIIGMGGLFKKATDLVEDELKQDLYGEIYPVNGFGFVTKRLEKQGKSFSINYYSGIKQKEWSYTPVGGKLSSATYLGKSENYLLYNIMKLNGAFDRSPEFFLLGLDIETGKVLFEKSTFNTDYKYLPLISRYDGTTKILGEYFANSQNILKDKSSGIVLWQNNEGGNIVSEKRIAWTDVFSEKMKINTKGKIDDFGYLFLHNVIYTDDESIFIIGEGFKPSGTKTSTTDMILIKLNKNFVVQEVIIYPKKANTISLDGGGAFMSNQNKGYAIKYDNRFDYAFTVTNSDNSSFSVCYTDNVIEGNLKDASFNSISYNNGKISTDKIILKTEATLSAILPAKQGQVLILDYYKKEKRLDVHFEKLN